MGLHVPIYLVLDTIYGGKVFANDTWNMIMRSEVLIMVIIKISALLDLTLCNLPEYMKSNSTRQQSENNCPHLIRRTEKVEIILLRKIYGGISILRRTEYVNNTDIYVRQMKAIYKV
jgi:hypothetical protein